MCIRDRGIVPVTQAQWAAVAAKAGLKTDPSHFKGATRPVECVSWYDAVRWCNAASALAGLTAAYRIGQGDEPEVANIPDATGFRLPTEAEWEYASRAGTTTRYWFGDDEGALPMHGWFRGNSGAETHPVGEKPANRWGLHDVHGNVWEWCDDGKRTYSAAAAADPAGERLSGRVMRGGSYGNSAVLCRSACRCRRGPDVRDWDQGFRVVCAVLAP